MRVLFITLISVLGLASISAQDVKFTASVSSDSVLFGNHIRVTFSIENGNAKNFEAPNFQGFNIVGGPNQSSSMSMVNGLTTQSMSYSYFIEPTEEGQFFIEPAIVEIDGNIFETEPIEIKVVPNPEGIIQHPEQRRSRSFNSFDSFFDRSFPPREEQQKKKPKKKRKIYKI